MSDFQTVEGAGISWAENHVLERVRLDSEVVLQLQEAFVAGAMWQARLSTEMFKQHTEAVAVFLNELYAIMVDPCAEGTVTVEAMKAALIAAALRDREDLQKLGTLDAL